MFTLSEMQNIRERCLDEMNILLDTLEIKRPDWNVEDISSFNSELDDEITKKICNIMMSKSILDGYTAMLKAGDIPFTYRETQNELLQKIIENTDRIKPKESPPAVIDEIIYTVTPCEKISGLREFLIGLKEKFLAFLPAVKKGELVRTISIGERFPDLYAKDDEKNQIFRSELELIEFINSHQGLPFSVSVSKNSRPQPKSCQISSNELQNILDVLRKLYNVVEKI
ncbi:MAG: hypothetical protein IJU48_08515 [Synergistaceae bacterium]|nr:hypothetical protein [Synergistaceae bacterium]